MADLSWLLARGVPRPPGFNFVIPTLRKPPFAFAQGRPGAAPIPLYIFKVKPKEGVALAPRKDGSSAP